MGEPQVKEKAWGAGPSGTGPTSAVPPSGRAGRPASSWARRLGAQLCVWHPSTMGPGARSLKGVSGPGPTRCVQAECFDQLVRHCVACRLLRTPEPRAAGASSQAPGTALQPQESVGPGAPQPMLPLPGLLFGIPTLLGLALLLALVLVALVSWKWRQRRTLEALERNQEEPLENVYIPSSGTPDTSAPVCPAPGEDPATTPPSHSVPVPATELGPTQLVTTKTAGPEQQ
ncbi:PREDICTED: tumor necrosis factor receptor superfamily member 13C isoform X2 [Chinchilla lanigera]|uniref:tumor necrosis factor receptor superfamily member 13C isoform X2 n=1 Tax=Chinchilla lanigera TaxID=34839 RepID=UPI00038ECA4A|nr:PREDICTED: tumor necrosis factor receptor superfamily member 13C isoform X2 [Chinchilla lanigera]